MTVTARLDHISFGVHDAIAWGRRVREVLGAVPISGETLAEFRWVLFQVEGPTAGGGRLELLDPPGAGFVQRFLDRHGEGPHHITFMVDDLRAAVAQVKALGACVVGESYGYAPWEEAFVFPDSPLGIVVQLAQSDRHYPTPAELRATHVRHHLDYPNSRGARDVTWWRPIWDTSVGPSATLQGIDIQATDLGFARALFGGVLGAHRSAEGEPESYVWPGGRIHVHAGSAPGVTAVRLAPGDQSLTIGGVTIGPAA